MDSGSVRDVGVSIIDKDESSDKAYHVVDGFVIEDSKKPFPNGQLSFVPEEYGKEKPPPYKKTRHSTNTPKHTRNVSPDISDVSVCEYCKVSGPSNEFLAPSRRFCSMSCCKRYSAEKRYYPYGKDEEGIAKAISEGLVNPNGKSVRQAAPGAKQLSKVNNTMREQRRRKMASFSKDKGTPNGGVSTSKSPRGKGRAAATNTPSHRAPPPEKKPTPAETTPLEVYSHPMGLPMQSWTADNVSDFLTFLGYEAYVDRFLEHEIDGRALSLIKDHHLIMTLKLRLGPALKIFQQINAIKAIDEVSDTE